MFLSYIYIDQLSIKDLKTVKKAVWGARTKWMDIGLELDLDVTDLTAIDATHRGDIGRCFIEMLTLWLKQVDPSPTWSAMVAALQEPIIGFGSLAEQVESNFVHRRSKAALDTTDSSPAAEITGGCMCILGACILLRESHLLECTCRPSSIAVHIPVTYCMDIVVSLQYQCISCQSPLLLFTFQTLHSVLWMSMLKN